jgi:hypothetical protein
MVQELFFSIPADVTPIVHYNVVATPIIGSPVTMVPTPIVGSPMTKINEEVEPIFHEPIATPTEKQQQPPM